MQEFKLLINGQWKNQMGEIVRETAYPAGGFNVLPSGYKEAEVLLK
jgi:hypothetical protein